MPHTGITLPDRRRCIQFMKQILRWSCWTRLGADLVYRRVVSLVRRSLTVALCFTDEDVVAFTALYPSVSTCPSVRLKPESSRSLGLMAVRSLKSLPLHPPAPTSGSVVATGGTCAGGSSAVPATTAATLAVKTAGLSEGKIPIGSGVKARSGEQVKRFDRCPSLTDGGLRLWSGATHAKLVGLLAFGRFQSTVADSKDGVPENCGVEQFEADTAAAIEEARCLFHAWTSLAEVACVEVFRTVQVFAGEPSGGDGATHSDNGVASGDGSRAGGGVSGVSGTAGMQPWAALQERCLRAIVEEGRGPRGASLQEVLLLFNLLSGLGCDRYVE